MFKTSNSRSLLFVVILVGMLIGIDVHSYGWEGLIMMPIRFVCGAILFMMCIPVLVWIDKGT
jgi:hypothetical protein